MKNRSDTLGQAHELDLKTPFVLISFLASFLAGSTTALAENPDNVAPIADLSERTKSATTIKPEYAQIEFGWAHYEENDMIPNARSDSFPITFIRLGLKENLELRFGFAGFAWRDVDSNPGSSYDSTVCGNTKIARASDAKTKRCPGA